MSAEGKHRRSTGLVHHRARPLKSMLSNQIVRSHISLLFVVHSERKRATIITSVYLRIHTSNMPRAAAGSSKKATKDPNAPKRPLSAFFLFSQDERPDIKKKNPSLSVGDVAKEIGTRWKKVSDDVKKRYEQKAAVEKQKYEVRLSEYKKSGGGGGSPAKASKGGAKASASKKSPKKPAPKKASAKSKSSDEDNDDDDEDDEEDDEE